MRDHGTLHFELVDNILFIEGCGPWNEEALHLFSRNMDLSRKKEIVGEWAVLINVIGDPIYTPSAARALIKYLKDEKQHGRVATAIILTDSNSPEVGKWHISAVYNEAGENFKFFDSKEDATHWLMSVL